ncbi:hypothetical protein RHSIM_RhsimUnG0046600 [Rhododendron simsii]|uniref:DUF7610 domain-containing protein n=1 Tax=Rhododendron simsii TaxID=118357 RepID=A0A834L4X9_RHOSS|nr:hypothetical protein RHSIM_RhsimUnG0046600 [Rhododendron simsii]
MTKRYQVLQRKLRELESLIARLSSPYPAIPSGLLANGGEIAQQLVFSRKLLSAEIASHPSKPHHLAHISRRLDRLDTIFRHNQDHHDHDVNDDFAVNDGLDAASTCSCTESCLNDDGEGEGEADLGSELCEEPEEEMFYEAPPVVVEEEEASVEEVGRVVHETKTEKGGAVREEEGDCVWGYFGVLGGGLVVGVAIGAVLTGFVMVRFSGCFHYIQDQGFLIPT